MQSTIDKSTITYRHLLMVVLGCVLMLGLVDYVARTVHNAIWYPNSYDHIRNLYFRRGWEQYTAPPETTLSDDTFLLIVISNSQAFLPERRDPTAPYAYQLQTILQEQTDRPVKVLNWSAVAGNAAEQIVLAARAIAHQPDAVLWIAHNDNFSREQFRPFTFYSTDIPRMVYHPEVRQYLSDEFLSIHSGYDPLEWLNVNTGLGKIKQVLEGERFLYWWWVYRIQPFGTHYYPWTDESAYYAREFYDTLNRGEQSIPMAFVSMPLNSEEYSDDEWQPMVELPENIRPVLEPLGVDVYDATTIIPNDLFFTSNHMRPPGHRQFAEWLADNVALLEKLDER